jgi:hypothetical protein
MKKVLFVLVTISLLYGCATTFVNGDKYVGEWKDDNWHGQGTFTLTNGYKYVGEFKDGQYDGQGTETLTNGSKYTGEFKNNKRQGQGTLTLGNGFRYVGEWKDDNWHGQGTFTLTNGYKYVGEFKDGQYDGQGTETLAFGSVKEGIWEDDTFLYAKKDNPNNSAQTSMVTNADDSKFSLVSYGSGFAVSSTGHVVTSNHVIDSCAYVNMHDRGKSIRATVLYRDLLNDLAVLKGDFVPSKVFKISRKNPKLMQDVFVSGYPFGAETNISSSVKVTKGIVNSLMGWQGNASSIQIDAAIQPGNSGGPIFDGGGNVIGVTVRKQLEPLLGVDPENMGFGIKSYVVVDLLESNGINIQEADSASKSVTELGEIVSGATYYLSCWMTMAQVKKMESSKVMSRDLTQ